MLCWNNNVNKSDSEKPKLTKSKVTETVKFKSKENLKVRNIFLEKQGKARRTVYQVEYEAERNIFQESFWKNNQKYDILAIAKKMVKTNCNIII